MSRFKVTVSEREDVQRQQMEERSLCNEGCINELCEKGPAERVADGGSADRTGNRSLSPLSGR